MSPRITTKKVVYVALAANLAIAFIKFAAAGVTASSAMLSEGVHSLVDTINELLLLYGMKRATKRPDTNHPFRYGRELYFWSFIVALLVFALGAGVSLYEGITHLQN
jgi:divalent metal cation (Fe/Co/Zn/Cd) transporter